MGDYADQIAVVGIGLNFPGADNLKDFWANLLSQKDLRGDFPKVRFDSSQFKMPQQGYFINDYAGFDPKEFGIKANVARQMDPMQWLALDTAKAAFDDGGISSDFLNNHECGVWCGVVSSDSYAQVALTPIEDYSPHTSFGCDQSMISGRLAYHFNLTGPALTINSACSSSLNAVIMGSQALQCGQCDMALVGGVHLYLNPTAAIIRSKAGILSPEGICRSYDEKSAGYALGEGCGFIILEKLTQARKLGHKVYGVIHSYAQGHGGKLGSLGQSQSTVIEKISRRALSNGHISVDDLSFIEGHGTGTVNGDMAELAAFSHIASFANHDIYLSSVKSHIGHLEAASGIAGLITALLELKQRTIVPAMHFEVGRLIGGEMWKNLTVPRKQVLLTAAEQFAIVNSCGLNGTVTSVIIQSDQNGAIELNGSIKRGPTKYQFTRAKDVIHRPVVPGVNENVDWAKLIEKLWREVLCISDTSSINGDETFYELGGNSLEATYMLTELCNNYNIPVEPVELFNYPTINSLTEFLQKLEIKAEAPSTELAVTNIGEESIAIIGAVGKFPGAQDCSEYWNNLMAGKITYQQQDDDCCQFPAAYFGYSEREAALIDPQQRLFLYQSWQLLKQTGYWQKETDIGVVAAAGPSSYLLKAVYEQRDFFDHYNNMEVMVGNNLGSLAGRVSYKLNLHGPSFSLDSHCSSALVALDEACQLLNNNRCKMVIAGGVAQYFEKIDSVIISPTGKCSPFSKKANGTIFQNGCGAVLLKRLSQAEKDGDEILAIVKATRTNQDGANKAGLCAPAGLAQEELLKRLLQDAKMEPADISYVEAHGSGTVLGDKLELRALENVFSNSKHAKIHFGCVKGNIGHCGQASGMAALIKAIYICKTKQIPAAKIDDPLLEFSKADNPFLIDATNCDFPKDKEINIIISNLGFAGTNSQLIVSSYNRDYPISDSILFKQIEKLSQKEYQFLKKETVKASDKLLNNTGTLNKDEILQILQEASGLESITLDTTIYSLGLDSLVLLNLLSLLKKNKAANLEPEAIFSCRTIGELLEKLETSHPRTILEEVILAICSELYSEKISSVFQQLPEPLSTLWDVLKQVYGVEFAEIQCDGNVTIATISNYISMQVNLLEIEEKSAAFLKEFRNE